MALTRFDVGNTGPCICGSAGTYSLFTGCGGNALASYSIKIYDHSGGTLLQTVVTDGTGHAYVTPAGSVWVQSSDGRFSGDTVTVASTIALTTVASGYVCAPRCCAIPIATTLHYTDVNCSLTLTYYPAYLNWRKCAPPVSVANAVVSIVSGPCTATLGTGNVPYWVVFGGTFSCGASVNVPVYDIGVGTSNFRPYSTDGAGNVATCADATGIALPSISCNAFLSTDVGVGSTTSLTCPPSLAFGGTFPATLALGAANPAAGAWSITE